MFGPRGVIHSWAMDRDDPAVDPRWGKIGKQKIIDTGPLTIERMKSIDDATLKEAKRFINDAAKEGKPWFVWFCPTRMHFYTHIKDEVKGISGQGFYNDGMVEHDRHVGNILDYLDQLNIADNNTYKVHLDGYNLLPYLTDKEKEGPRIDFFYFNDDTDSNNYYHWWLSHAFILVPAQHIVGNFLKTLKEFPPSQKPAEFSVQGAMEKLKMSFGG